MRIPRILARYIVREIVQYSVLGFLVFATLMLTQNLLRTLGDLAEAAGSVVLGDLITVLAYLLPVLATYAVPVSFLFGVLLAVGRMASDSEVTAMRACGLGLRELVVPVLVLSVLVSLGTAHLMQRVEPRARQELRRVVKQAASRSLTVEAGSFRALSKRVVYAREHDVNGNLLSVVIWDNSNPGRPFTVFAERGRLHYNAEQSTVDLILEQGDMHMEPSPEEPDRYRRIGFETFNYSFDVSEFVTGEAVNLRPRDMSMQELYDTLDLLRTAENFERIEHLRERDPRVYETQIHRRFAIPLAPVVFALLAVPLGLRRVRGARSAGTMMCVALAFAYYTLLSLAEFLGEKAGVPPAVALWLPNATFLALAIPLLHRARRGDI
jgi:lipopolysaccharide export system permease protein